MIDIEMSPHRLLISRFMANTIAERCRGFHAVVDDSVYESGSDLFLMRSTIVPWTKHHIIFSRRMPQPKRPKNKPLVSFSYGGGKSRVCQVCVSLVPPLAPMRRFRSRSYLYAAGPGQISRRPQWVQ